MRYNKPPISFTDQVAKLKQRGLTIANDDLAERYLSNISFYRLRAYTYPFQNNDDPNHPFNEEVSFQQIIELYNFDRKLRLLFFDALERIEIALRTQVIYQWSMKYGSHWYEDRRLAKNSYFFQKNRKSLQKDLDRSQEKFIEITTITIQNLKIRQVGWLWKSPKLPVPYF